jgi:hypothetical protein
MTTDDVVVDVTQDWVLACDVQRRFMQGLARSSDSVDYSARCRQVRALGGDCYDFMPLTTDRLALVVGDASGKGVAAALMIASVQSSLRTAALFTGKDLTTLLKIVNLQAYVSSLADRPHGAQIAAVEREFDRQIVGPVQFLQNSTPARCPSPQEHEPRVSELKS